MPHLLVRNDHISQSQQYLQVINIVDILMRNNNVRFSPNLIDYNSKDLFHSKDIK